ELVDAVPVGRTAKRRLGQKRRRVGVTVRFGLDVDEDVVEGAADAAGGAHVVLEPGPAEAGSQQARVVEKVQRTIRGIGLLKKPEPKPPAVVLQVVLVYEVTRWSGPDARGRLAQVDQVVVDPPR